MEMKVNPFLSFVVIGFILLSTTISFTQTNVSGNQSGTWTLSGSPYILTGDVTVPSGNTLIIDAGVEVQFPNYSYDIDVNGSLFAVGTAQDSIRFVGMANPGVSASTHGGRLDFYNADSSALSYVVIDRMGDASTASYAVYIRSSDVDITHATIRNSESTAVHFISTTSASLTDSKVEDNAGNAIYIDNSAVPTLTNNSFSNNGKDIYSWLGGLTKSSANADAQVYLYSSSISQDATLPFPGSNSKYVLDNTVTINNGATLTIAPGTEIIFPHYNYNIDINGRLLAQGTAQDSIRFTGVPNANISSSSHGGRLYFYNADSSMLSYVVLDQMGDASTVSYAMYVRASEVSLSHSAVRNSESTGLYVLGDSQLTIDDCNFRSNAGNGIYIQETAPSVTNSTFSDNGKDILSWLGGLSNLSDNPNTNVYIASSSTTQDAGLPYLGDNSVYILDNSVTVNDGTTLTIAPGVEMIFPHYNYNLNINGRLLAEGTTQDSIRFTGIANPNIANSSHGGRLYFYNADSSVLSHVVVDQMGDASTSAYAMYIRSSAVHLSNSSVRNSESTGLYIFDNSQVVVESCSFQDNAGNGIYITETSPLISNSSFSNNGKDILSWLGGLSNLSNNQNADIYITSSSISQDAVLPFPGVTSVYILDNSSTVSDGATLTIEPGVEIIFPHYNYNLTINGRLLAEGTAQDSIRFTGIANPNIANSSHGGRLYFYNADSSKLAYAVVDRMGDASTGGDAVYIRFSDVQFSHSSIRNSESIAVNIIENNHVIIDACNFQNNPAVGIYVVDFLPTIRNSTFSNNGKDIRSWLGGLGGISNVNNAEIYLISSSISQDAGMNYPGANSVYILENTVTVNDGATLSIDPGVELIFPHYSYNLNIYGRLLAEGTAQDSIRFRGVENANISNSSHGGKLYFYTADSSRLSYAAIEQLGDVSTGSYGVEIRSSELIMEYCTVRNSESIGIYIRGADSEIAINHSLIHDQPSVGIYITETTPQITNCSFARNGKDIFSWLGGLSSLANNEDAGIYIFSSSITTDAVLSQPGPGSYYALDNSVTINAGATLTIEPGVEFRFPHYGYDLNVSGTLIAVGTEQDSIRFIGLPNPGLSANSTHGGKIYFRTGSTNSVLKYTLFDTMGDKDYSSNGGRAIWVTSSSVDIQYSVFKNSEIAAIYVDDGTQPLIAHCIFQNNPKAMRAHAEGLSNLSNNNDASIYILSGTIDVTTKFSQPGNNSYYILEGDITISQGDTLTIDPGVEIRFENQYHDINIQGTLLARGTAQDSIRFVGVANPQYHASSTHGGKLYFYGNSTNSVLEYTVFDQMGDNDITSGGRAVWVLSSSLEIARSHFRNSELAGIYIDDNVTPMIRNCTFENNPKGIRSYPEGLGQLLNLHDAAIYIISGTVNESARFTKPGPNSYFALEGDFTIAQGDTLTIDPGVEIRFENQYHDINVQGTLLARGTELDSIRFVGVADPQYHASSTHGGKLYFYGNSANSILEYTVFDQMGDNDITSGGRAVWVLSSSLEIAHSHFRNNELAGIYIDNNVSPVIRNCNFQNNPKDIRSYPEGLGQLLNLQDAAIYIISGTIDESARFAKPGPNSYFALEGDFTIAQGDTLTIDPGVEIRFENQYYDINIRGTLLARGTQQDSIRFVGVANPQYHASSTHGGKLYFYSNSTNSILEYTVFDQMGDQDVSAGGRALYVSTSSLEVQHTAFKNSELDGIYIENHVTPSITDCRFYNNPKDIHAYPEGLSYLSNNPNTEIYVQSGSIDQYTTIPWPGNNSHYILEGDISVLAGDTLKIDPGAEIHFTSYSHDIYVRGTLLAQGSPQDSIKFLGFANPALSNSTHGGRVYFDNSSKNSIVSYAVFDQLGDIHAGIGDQAVALVSSSVNITNCTFSNSEEAGVNIVSQDSIPFLQNNVFYNNPEDIVAYANSVSQVRNNTNARIFLAGSTLNDNATIPYPGANSYYILRSDLSLTANHFLLIEPGTRIELLNSTTDLHIYGTLLANGTEQAVIQFTHIPGTNSHGGALILYEDSQNSQLRYVNMDHLGDASYYGVALDIRSPSVSISNLNVTNSEAVGIYISNDVSPTIINSSIQQNQRGVSVASGAPTFYNCNILGNAEYGIFNTGQDTVDARSCWWGDVSGPLHQVTNPGGLGNEVTDRVLFDPWLQQPVNNQIIDLAITDHSAPTTDCGLSAAEDISVRVFNYGNISVSDLTLGYSINGGPTVMETPTVPTIVPAASLEYTFSTPADLSIPGNYNIEVYLSVQQDSVPENDTLRWQITHFEDIAAPANLTPADGSIDLNEIVNFSWQAVPNAATYDLYLWPDGSSKPATPTKSGISQIGYTYPQVLDYGVTYNWQVAARRNSCLSESTVQQFTIRELPDLHVDAIQVPLNPFSEQTIEVSWQVMNQGSGGTGSTQWHDAVYLSASPSISGATYLGALPNLTALGPGESYSQSANYTLPQGIQGTYYILVRTDRYSRVGESDEDNNDSFESMNVTLTPPPDLQVSSVIGPNNAFSEQPITVNWTVTNEGSGATTVTGWYERVYISTSEAFNPFLSTLLHSSFYQHGDLLDPDESYNRSETVTLPQGIYGDHYLHIVTDATNRVFEFAFEDNNVGTSSVMNVILTPPPDLIVTDVHVPDSLSIRENFTVQWTVLNQGANPAEASWTDRIYLSPNEDFNAGGLISLGTRSRNTDLAAGASYSTQQTVNVPSSINGKFYVFVETDYNDRVYEFNNENNNSGRSDSLIISVPDLAVTALTIPATAESGETITVSWQVQNEGVGRVVSTSIQDRIYLSTEAVYNNSAQAVGTLNYNLSLVPGAALFKQQTITLPDGIEGTYYIHLRTDVSNNVFEDGMESNNTSTAALSVQLAPYPDLIVNSIGALPDSIQAGTPFPLTFEIQNTWTGVAEGSTWYDKVYASTHPVWDPNKVTLIKSTERLQSLESGGSYNLNSTISIPMLSSMVAGLDSFANVYLYFYTDAEDDIYEFGLNNENNITRSNAIWVACPPPVDLEVTAATSSGENFFSGDPVTVAWTVRNIGSTTEYWDYPLWYDGFFLSRDTIWDNTDIFIEDFTEPGPLDEGASYSDNQTFNLPYIAEGTYYLLLVADHQNRNRDADRNNNTWVIPFSGQVDTLTGEIIPIEVTQTLYPDLRLNNFVAPINGTTGQPIAIEWNVSNIGEASAGGTWTDRIYLSTDFIVDNSDIVLGSRNRPGPLGISGEYTETMEVNLPINKVGNFILLMKTDATSKQFELNRESNNVLFSPIFIEQPAPADLVVTSVTAPNMAMVNSDMDVSWTVKNQGQFPANGRQKDIVYLSVDSLLSIDDIRLGIKEVSSNLAPLAQESRSLTMTPTPGLPIGDYYLLVQTDALNNIYESVDTNNVGMATEKITITVPELPLDVLLPETLVDETPLYYRIEIPDSLAGETMLVSLQGDPASGRNELYLSYGLAPTRSNHDFSYGNALQDYQDIVVPAVEAGTYYLLAYGNSTTGTEQAIELKAELIEFQIRSVQANKGGNTGSVTVKVEGAKFAEDMLLHLGNSELGTIYASKVYFIDATKVFATFDLRGVPVGQYDMVANLGGNSTSLPQGFQVLEGAVGSFFSEAEGAGGTGGSNSGFFCSIDNIGVDNLLSSNVQHPPNTRINRVVPITIQFGNNANVDVPMPCRFIISLRGAPLSFSAEDFSENLQELYLEFKEPGGPPDVLRPGATGAITVYAKSSAPMRFLVKR